MIDIVLVCGYLGRDSQNAGDVQPQQMEKSLLITGLYIRVIFRKFLKISESFCKSLKIATD